MSVTGTSIPGVELGRKTRMTSVPAPVLQAVRRWC
jgi:hypothetical protein